MKKITFWVFVLLSSWQISAQVGIIQNFDSATTLPTGWTETGGKTIAAAESCSGNSIRDNLYASSNTGTLVTPNQVAASNATDLTVSFDYKIEVWNTTNANPAGWGNIQVQYSINNGGAWTTFFTINDANHVVANTCANFSNVIPAASLPNGSDVRIRFLYTWAAGDYDIYIDNFSATQVTVVPPLCTVLSTPANGATNVLGSTISWNAAGGLPTGYKLNVGTISGGTDVLNLFDVGNVTNYTLPALTSGTTYYVKVIPYNANGDATGCTETSFTTCGAITTLPHLEPFTTFLPNCWTEADNGDLAVGPATVGAGSWLVDGLGNVGTTGAIRVTLDATGDNDWVVSPEFTIPAAGYELKFIAAANQSGATTAPTTAWESDDSIEVLVTTTGMTNWTPIFIYNDGNVPSNTGSINTIDLSSFSAQTVRFAFRAIEGATNGSASVDFSVDNFEIRLTPTCPDQTGLTVNNITGSGANTSWDDTSGTGAIGYQYAITTSATPPASGTGTTNTYYIASGLNPQTVYYLHVRSECAGSTFGNWGTTTFTTGCAPIASLPWTENFDALTTGTNVFPACWGYTNTTSTWSISTTPTAYSGANSLRRTWSTDGWAYTPMATLTAGVSYRFSYYVRTNDNVVGYDITVGVGNSQDSAAMNTTLSTVAGYQGPAWVRVNHEFTPTVTGDYSFGVHVVAPVSPNGINFDNFRLELSPTCPDQTGLVVGNISSSGADTSWDDMSALGAVGYEYAVTTSATPPASGTQTTATFYIASGLLPQTVYYLHVRSECAGSTYGVWATTTFTTACVPLALPWLENFDALTPGTNVFPNCWNYSNTTSTWSISTTPTAYSGANSLRRTWSTDGWAFTPMFTLTAGTSYTFSYFVRTNDTTVGYDVTVGVGNSQNSAAMNTTLSTVVGYQGPAWTLVSLEYTPTVSGDYSFGVHVVAPLAPNGINFDNFELKLTPACPAPLASASGVTDAAANLSWAAVPSAALGYEYVLDNVATDPAGSGTSTMALAYPASGLNASTLYYFHIRSVCSAGTYSTWSTVSFTTLATPPVNDNCSNATVLTPGATFATNPLVATNVGATGSTETAPGCASYSGGDVWYSVLVPASGSITLETDTNTGTTITDTGLAVYSGACGALVLVECDDDDGTNGNFSLVALTGRTPGELLYVRAWEYGNDTFNTFKISAYDASLSSSSFDRSTFVAYPNPVKDVLNLSYKSTISNVRVINLLGQEVLNTKTNANDVQVNMSALTAGAYIVNITVDDTVHTIKVIKE
ncbi:T9SS type A sorting domain-containing protein [Flavobacterium terrigena]|uniref:Por secretion system C-terminal sorting domain-containing protein n=1 Tax=Flavobacterium terrigena TaxID=402734 RepID=A0A1H6V3X9_9FLAO|nr:T9SS type A sorting domain-containing protein [Flavobacterium terrigena]SEI95360.1 Por secretion system C-terminal sorting domain-containing protein [Flavobacterium terrigena]